MKETQTKVDAFKDDMVRVANETRPTEVHTCWLP